MALNPAAFPMAEQVQETFFDHYYHPYKKQIFGVAAALAVVVVSFLAVREWRNRQRDERWSRFTAAITPGTSAFGAPADPRRRIDLLQAVVRDYPEDDVTPYAMSALIDAYAEVDDFDQALATLEQIRTRFKDFVLNTASIDTPGEKAARSLAERSEAILRAEKEWRSRTAYVHPEPSKDRLALVETTAGNFWMAFYPDQAPDHVRNFIELAKSGWFNGTQVYEARRTASDVSPAPMAFEAGSAASRYEGPDSVRDPGQHDRDEPTHVLDPEEARTTIRHRYGIVTSVLMPSGESARRFLVICAKQGLESAYNRQNTPFAAVLDREGSLATIDAIALAPTYGTDPTTKDHAEAARMRDHPYPPIWIRRVSIWKDEKLEPGHTWDTARCGSSPSQPEPWEATLPAPPKPEEFAPK
jgi:cyclophilin family peptidyl-prolyl cis-trans isomerase